VSGSLTPVLAACGSKVADSCERKYGLLLGSGTTALTLACRMTPPGQKKVIVPAIACTHVLFAVFYAECTPVFVDICPESGLLDPEMVRVALERDPAIGAVIVVHTYGHIAELHSIANHAKASGALVIEDAAQAQGGVYADGRPLGSMGDLSLVSFGHTKILDVGGGGVLMTNRQDLYETGLALAEELPPSPVELEARFAQYRASYYSEWNARVIDASALIRIGMLHRDFRDVFLHRADDETGRRIIEALTALPSQVAARIELAAEYATLLSGLNAVRLCRMVQGSVPWRFVIRVPSYERDVLVNHLRRSGLDVSSWYPSLAHFWEPEPARATLPNAGAFAEEVVNLWVTPGYDRRLIRTACQMIRAFFE
jgi:dTDP-4-amino-4,6-dideoxygalactose transaminase